MTRAQSLSVGIRIDDRWRNGADRVTFTQHTLDWCVAKAALTRDLSWTMEAQRSGRINRHTHKKTHMETIFFHGILTLIISKACLENTLWVRAKRSDRKLTAAVHMVNVLFCVHFTKRMLLKHLWDIKRRNTQLVDKSRKRKVQNVGGKYCPLPSNWATSTTVVVVSDSQLENQGKKRTQETEGKMVSSDSSSF